MSVLKNHGNMSERKDIQIFFRRIIIIGFFIIVFLHISIIIQNKRFKNYEETTLATEISVVLITNKNGPSKDAIFLSKSNFINTSAELIGNSALNYDFWELHDIVTDRYSLFNLKVPYSLYKEKDNDTINVIKDSIKIQFLMINNE